MVIKQDDKLLNDLAIRFNDINKRVDKTYNFDILIIISIIIAILEWLFGWNYSKQDIIEYKISWAFRQYLAVVVNRQVRDWGKTRFIMNNLPMFLNTLTSDELDKVKNKVGK